MRVCVERLRRDFGDGGALSNTEEERGLFFFQQAKALARASMSPRVFSSSLPFDLENVRTYTASFASFAAVLARG